LPNRKGVEMEVGATEGVKQMLKKASSSKLIKLRPDKDIMTTKGSNKLLSPRQEKKYEDKFVAISNRPEKKIVASADTYSALIKEARKTAKNPFCVIFVPKEGVIYSH